MAISVPPVRYDATAARPDWPELPTALRAAIETRLGAPVRAARTARGGFTQGFTALLETADGDRAFVKAASLAEQWHLCDWYAREAAVTAALPAGLPVPRPRWTLSAGDWYALCLEPIDARMPGLPWHPDELSATLTGYARLADALREPPAALLALHPPRLAELAREDLACWREIATGRTGLPAGAPAGVRERLADLVALEALLPGYAESGALIHGDLRLDNVLLDRAGTAWFCDWNWFCFGPPWFDLATLLITGYASGLPVDALFADHPAARDAPPDGLDAALAALAGYSLCRAASGAAASGAHHALRAHQQWSGEQSWAWLAQRRGWS